jgi:molybdate transport system substrate-binding protein
MPADATPPLRLMSTLGVKGMLETLLPGLERALGRPIAASFAPTNVLLDRLDGGEPADAVILTEAAIRDLSAAGRLLPGTEAALARSLVGMAVRAGAPRPDIATEAALRRTLLETPSLAYSRTGASGIFFAALIGRMGIADAVNAKAIVIPIGLTGEKVASGEAVLAVQQLSELMLVPGIDILGPLPMELQEPVVFSAAVLVGGAATEAAAALLREMATAFTPALLRAKGLTPPAV